MPKEYENLFCATYLNHYERGNFNCTDPQAMAAKVGPNLDATYGSYISQLSPGSRILDLGCGTGYLLYWLSQKGMVACGVDQSSSMIDAARQSLSDLEIYLDNGIEFLQRHPDSFSAIFCHDVLEHLASNELCVELVAAARNALLPGGFFICRVPNAANITSSHMRYIDFTHMRSFTSFSILQLFEAVGFVDCHIIPLRRHKLIRQVHLNAVTLFHRILYLFCGNRKERHFHKVITAVGFNPMKDHSKIKE